MKSQEVVISEGAKITVGVLIVFIGLSAWLTTIYAQGDSNAKSIIELKERQSLVETMSTDIALIKRDISEIRRKIDR